MEYIGSKQTATTIHEASSQNPGKKEIVTSEIIYNWLVALNIPFDPVENWHLHRLVSLVKVTNIKNGSKQQKGKMSKSQIAQQQKEINDARLAKYGTSG